MSTTEFDIRLRNQMNNGDPAQIATVARKVNLGTMLSEIKVVVTGLTAAAAIDVTTAAVKAAATITGMTLLTGENLPAIGFVRNLRVTASGTAGSLGTYGISDASGTAIVPPGGASAALGIATLSDDGKTLTFPNTITAFVLTYYPKAYTSLDTDATSGI